MRTDGVIEHKRPQPHTTWQPTSNRLSAERQTDPPDVGGSGSGIMSADRLVAPSIKGPREGETRSPQQSVTSASQALRLQVDQLLLSAKRSLMIVRQSAQQKRVARAASRKARQRARELAKLRAVLLVSWPSEQAANKVKGQAEDARKHAAARASIIAEHERYEAEQAPLKAKEEATRKTEEERRHGEQQARVKRERQQARARLKAQRTRKQAAAQARIKAELELQQVEQARLKTEEEAKRQAEGARKQAAAQARIKAEQARLKAEEESFENSKNKHCPKCERAFGSDQAYCALDATRLVSATDAHVSPAYPWRSAQTGPTVWILVIITFLGTAILGLKVVSYISNGPSSATSTKDETRQPANTTQPAIGGKLSGKETSLPIPEYPERAKSERASGKVTVSVLVNKKGIVISARVLDGHPLLRVPALAAARKARFAAEKLVDQRTTTSGTITYSF